MTSEELTVLKHLYEQSQLLTAETVRLKDAQLATARTMRHLADGLSSASERQLADDRALVVAQKTLSTLVSAVAEVQRHREPAKMSADELIAAGVEFNTFCRGRQIIWARNHNEPDPLPPMPHDLVPVKAPEEPAHNRRKGDSLTIAVGRDGRTRVAFDFASLKTTLPWLGALGLGALEAWRAWQGL